MCNFVLILYIIYGRGTRENYLLRDKNSLAPKEAISTERPFPPKDLAGIESLVGEFAKTIGAVSSL